GRSPRTRAARATPALPGGVSCTPATAAASTRPSGGRGSCRLWTATRYAIAWSAVTLARPVAAMGREGRTRPVPAAAPPRTVPAPLRSEVAPATPAWRPVEGRSPDGAQGHLRRPGDAARRAAPPTGETVCTAAATENAGGLGSNAHA